LVVSVFTVKAEVVLVEVVETVSVEDVIDEEKLLVCLK